MTDYSKKYKRMLREMRDHDEITDYEAAHCVQDDIYASFVHDIRTGKFKDMVEVTKIAKKIESGMKKSGKRWYS